MDQIQAVEKFVNAVSQTTDHFNVRQTALYTGLQVEELAEKLEAIGLSVWAKDLYDLSASFKVGHYDDMVSRADREELLDADIDLAWVTFGSSLSQGADVAGAFGEVVRANLAKVGPDGVVLRDENGKIQKPAGWTPPCLDKFIQGEPNATPSSGQLAFFGITPD